MIFLFNKSKAIVWSILLFSILISCKNEEFSIEKITPEPVIVVLGSSTSAGAGLKNIKKSWVNILDSSFVTKFKVVNLAKSGYTTYQCIPSNLNPIDRPISDTLRNITKALKYNPKIIIVNLPTNDIASGFTLEEYFKNLDTLFAIAKLHHIKMYISTSQPRNLSLAKRLLLKDIRDKTINRYKKYSIDFWGSFATDDGIIKPEFDQGDGVHLNPKGHRILFKLVKKVLKDNRDAD